jgi:hypothetical protein
MDTWRVGIISEVQMLAREKLFVFDWNDRGFEKVLNECVG